MSDIEKKSRTQMRVTVFENVYKLLMQSDAEFELDTEFEKDCVKGIVAHLEELQNIVANLANDFKQDRLYKVDFAILILASFELIYCLDTPHEVIINEAVELAKKYSTEKSQKFINGILAKVLTQNTKRLI